MFSYGQLCSGWEDFFFCAGNETRVLLCYWAVPPAPLRIFINLPSSVQYTRNSESLGLFRKYQYHLNTRGTFTSPSPSPPLPSPFLHLLQHYIRIGKMKWNDSLFGCDPQSRGLPLTASVLTCHLTKLMGKKLGTPFYISCSLVSCGEQLPWVSFLSSTVRDDYPARFRIPRQQEVHCDPLTRGQMMPLSTTLFPGVKARGLGMVAEYFPPHFEKAYEKQDH